MSNWDLALSTDGDLIVLSNGDIAGISGGDLIEQRMLIRLRVRRGSWIYDASGNFGSQLQRLIGMRPNEAKLTAQAYVNEALRDMTEIAVDTVDISMTANQISLVVNYRIVSDASSSRDDVTNQLVVSIPVGGSI